MNNISAYIQEKLIINKDIKLSKDAGDDYWYGDLPNADKLLPEEFYQKCKSKRGKDPKKGEKNKPWYAVVLYLLHNGPTKVTDIRNDLWPGKTGQQAELFTSLKALNVIKSNKGYQELQPFKDWQTDAEGYWVGAYINKL